MRKIVVTEFITLDGVIENPGWSFPYWNDAISDFKAEETNAADALLMGRVTYDGFSAAWPDSPDEGAPYMNSVRKYVVSTTLENPEWNNSVVISDDVVEEIKKLKEQAGGDILVYGSGNLIQTLIEHDLIDSLRLLVYPIVLGKGQRLFTEDNNLTLNLVNSKIFDNGVTGLVYEPVKE